MSAALALGIPHDRAKPSRALAITISVSTPHGVRTVSALVDSGAEENFIDQRVVKAMDLPSEPLSVRANATDGHHLRTYGQVNCETHATDGRGVARSLSQAFIATNIIKFDIILGWPWLIGTDCDCHWRRGTWYYRATSIEDVQESHIDVMVADAHECEIMAVYMWPSLEPDRILDAGVSLHASEVVEVVLPAEYSDLEDIFSEKGAAELPKASIKVRHSIVIEPDKQIPLGHVYPLSPNELQVLREYLDTNLASGRVRRSESQLGASILFVQKKDGTLRLCVDYRALNSVTVKNRHPLPLISETIDRLSGAAIYTKLDLKDAYHRIRIQEGDEWKTAFRTRYGHFEYTVMPFGLTNAPATFQAYINEALMGLLDISAVAYMDDIMIFSATREEHTEHVRQVLLRLRKYGLFVNLAKCEFSTDVVDFLGYRISVAGVSMDPSRVQAIIEWPTPTSFREIQVFLGFANFYRGFIVLYSKVCAPINELLVGMVKGKKSGPFAWTEAANAAFLMLKDCFSTAPMIVYFVWSRRSRVEVDASGMAIGGILTQAYESPRDSKRTIWKPVAFYSRKLNPAERNYATGDAEMLAIVEAFRAWRHYLESPAYRVLVLTDHHTLQSFLTTKPLGRMQARWAEILGNFDLQIVYRKGTDNPADGLSRRPDHMVAGEPERTHPMIEVLRNAGALSANPAQEAMLAMAEIRQRKKSKIPTERAFNTLLRPSIEGIEGSVYVPPAPRMRRGGSSSAEESEDDSHHASDSDDQTLGKIPDSMSKFMLKLQSTDAWLQGKAWESHADHTIRKGAYEGKWTMDPAGLMRCDGAVYVPDDRATKLKILLANHDDPWQGGHFGRRRTLEVIRRFYTWPKLAKDVRKYCKSCDVCQRMKVPRHKPYGLLQPLPMPERPWQDISMDFVVGLPPSKRREVVYDSILVVVCRYSKMVRFIPCYNDITAPELADTLVDEIFSKFGVPRSIVSDRGTTFTSDYWRTICYHAMIKRCFSTAFHPQSDGQTERMNQTLECYLRCYINYEQDDWAVLLAGAEYAYNDSTNATTGRSPFKVVFNFMPQLNINIEREAPEHENESARAKVIELQRAQQDSEALWSQTQRTVKAYYDKKHQERIFLVGELVLLAAKHIRTLRASKKLADRNLGPFKILGRKGQNAYTLDLPVKYGRLHPTFHVSLLEPYHMREGRELPEPVDIDGEDEWEVEQILNRKVTKGVPRWLVRWKGFSEAEDTWEPAKNLVNAEALLQAYEKSAKGMRGAK
jgi:transposase InsO family protein